MDDHGQEMMQYMYVQNGYGQPIVMISKVDKWWLFFTENEGWVLITVILAKQEKSFWNKLPNCNIASKYGMSGIPPKMLVWIYK